MKAIWAVAAGLSIAATGATAQDLPNLDGRNVVFLLSDHLPSDYRFEQGDRSSLEHEILAELGRRLNLEIEWESVDADAMAAMIAGGRGDVAADHATIDAPRAVPPAFSAPYLELDLVVLAPAHAADYALTDRSLSVGAVVGASQAAALERLLHGNKDRLVTYDSDSDAAASLVSGRVDLIVIDHMTAQDYEGQTSGEVVQVGPPISAEVYAFIVVQDAELAHALNAALQSMKDDGTLGAYTQKWRWVWDRGSGTIR